MFDYVDFLYDRFGVRELAHAELATRPDNKLGTDEQWDHTEGVLAAGARADRPALPRRGGRGRVLRAEDRLLHGRRARPCVADGDDPARRAAARAARAAPTWAPTTASTRRTSSIARCSARSSASSGSCSSTTAAPSRSGSRRCRCASCRWARRISTAAREPRAGGLAPLPRRGRRAERDDRQADPGRRAREDPVHGRLRRPESEREPRGARARRRAVHALPGRSSRKLDGLLPLTPEKQGRTRSSPPGPQADRGGSTESKH